MAWLLLLNGAAPLERGSQPCRPKRAVEIVNPAVLDREPENEQARRLLEKLEREWRAEAERQIAMLRAELDADDV